MEEKIFIYLNELDQDIKALDEMLEDDACLTHITGYVQSKKGWLSLVADDYFAYRKITSKNIDISKLTEDVYLVVYDWTIEGNSVWKFKNELKLKYNDEILKWTDRNKIYFR